MSLKQWKYTNGYEPYETLPEVNSEDNGKVVGVADGAYALVNGGGGGGSAEPLIVNIVEEEITWTLDKTWAEIKAAMQSGVVLVSYENEVYGNWLSPILYIFDNDNENQYTVTVSANGAETSFGASSADGYPSMRFD